MLIQRPLYVSEARIVMKPSGVEASGQVLVHKAIFAAHRQNWSIATFASEVCFVQADDTTAWMTAVSVPPLRTYCAPLPTAASMS